MGDGVAERRNTRAIRSLTGIMLAAAVTASPAQAPDRPDAAAPLFSASFDKGLLAEQAGGTSDPSFASGVRIVPDGVRGSALAVSASTSLAWDAPDNIHAQRGLVSFFWRARDAVGTTPFPIFRVGYPDHSSWDMVFLRIDWNGHGYDAFVTDTNLARTRVSFRLPEPPDAKAWTHIAFGWDERDGVRLWVDGKPAARNDRPARYDAALFGFGPFQRILSGISVHSANNFIRSGDFDELRIFGQRLDDAAVARLARHETADSAPAATLTLADPATRRAWLNRFGWAGAAPPYLDAAATRIRKVEFSDARDLKQKLFRGIDGIRETTWPGVYNRSRLLGRNDYFKLPDWNVYSESGTTYRLTLPDEPWNRVEITGAAFGRLDHVAGGKTDRIADRPAGIERSTTQLAIDRRGGELHFTNRAQETPIQEIAAYAVTPGAAPDGLLTLRYTIQADAAPDHPTLDTLNAYIAGRHVADERTTVVALPGGAPRQPRSSPAAAALPIVHVLVPANFRDSVRGQARSRFSYGWQNLDAGLDGIAIDLPALKFPATHDGLIPLNIRIKDPTWPDRDLLDVNVAVKPGEARTLWLDTRDRLLPADTSLYLTIASASRDFSGAALDGAGVRLVFNPASEARAEHIADRMEQARDNFAFNVEERPGTRLYPAWTRFERDIGDVLRVDPGNALARAYWVESNSEQPYAAAPPIAVPAGVPRWAWLQTENLKLYRQFVDWWIDERQVANGEFGGGLSDDTDLVNQWVPLALMGVAPERMIASQRDVLDATYANGMWTNGLSRIHGDELHSYEEGINAVAQAMLMRRGDPSAIERAMEVARNYPRLAEVNAVGHTHIVSSYFSGDDIVREAPWGWQQAYSFLILHPGMLLVDHNGAPEVRRLILALLDGWLAHVKTAADGSLSLPSDIEWATDAERGRGVASASHLFWQAWRWTGDAKYLAPISDLGAAGSLNADIITQLGKDATWGAELAQRGSRSGAGRVNNTNVEGGGDRFARFVQWQQTGDNAILERIYEEEIASNRARMPILTEGHLWSDRVAVPTEMLQRARMGGVALSRNAYAPGNLVSWRFGDPNAAQQVGILIAKGGDRGFTVTLHNLSTAAIKAEMIGGEIVPGEWDIVGPAEAGAARLVQFERGAGVPLMLPPGRTVSYRLALKTAGTPTADRPDLGISRDDVSISGRRLAVVIHSLGGRSSDAGQLLVEDAAGRELARAPIPPLAAPLDLQPRTTRVALSLPRGAARARWRIRLKLNDATREVTLANNVVPLD